MNKLEKIEKKRLENEYGQARERFEKNLSCYPGRRERLVYLSAAPTMLKLEFKPVIFRYLNHRPAKDIGIHLGYQKRIMDR